MESKEERMRYKVTESHLRLLNHLRFRTQEGENFWEIVSDGKRPFGSQEPYKDMMNLLKGLELVEDADKLFLDLHWVIQLMGSRKVNYMFVEPGSYEIAMDKDMCFFSRRIQMASAEEESTKEFIISRDINEQIKDLHWRSLQEICKMMHEFYSKGNIDVPSPVIWTTMQILISKGTFKKQVNTNGDVEYARVQAP